MGAHARRRFTVGLAAAAVIVGTFVAPTQALAAAPAPTGLAPNDPGSSSGSGDTGSPIKNVELTWADTGANSYRVQIAGADGRFTNPSIDTVVTIPRYAPPTALPHGDWAWRVASDDSKTWSEVAWFTRGWEDAPADVHVVGDLVQVGGPTLTWEAVPDASYYEVQFSDEPFQGPNDSGSGWGEDGDEGLTCYTQNTVLTPYKAVKGEDIAVDAEADVRCEEIAGGPYFWRVRGRDGVFDPRTTAAAPPAESCTGVWFRGKPTDPVEGSADCSRWGMPDDEWFGVDQEIGLDELPAPTGLDVGPKLADTPDPVSVTNAPVFTWDPVPGASFYRVYQSRTPNHATAQHVWETTGTALSPVTDDPNWHNRLYWSVQTCTVDAPEEPPSEENPFFVLDQKNGDVRCGPESPFRTYKRAELDVVQPISTVVEGDATVLSWTTLLDADKPFGSLQNATNEAAGYVVEVSGPDGDFSAPSFSANVDRIGTTAGTARWAVPTAELPVAWTWRVRAFDETDNEYPWSDSPAKADAPSLTTTISTSASGVVVGDALTWTVAVENSGTASAANVTVPVTVPDGVSLVSTTPSGAITSGTWNVGTIPAGQTRTLVLATTVSTTGAITLQTCATTTTPEINPADNCASRTVASEVADLALTAEASATSVKVNGTVNWTVSVVNQGSTAAAGTTVALGLPSGVQVLSSTPAVSGSTWNIGTLNAGASRTLSLDTKVTTGPSVAISPCAATTTTEATSSNNCDSASVSVVVPEAPLVAIGTTTVDLTTPVLVEFSEQPAGVSSTTLRLKSDGVTVPGTSVTSAGDNAYLVRPSRAWVAGARYSLDLRPGVVSAGTGLAYKQLGGTARAVGLVDSASPALKVVKGTSKWSSTRASGAVGQSFLLTKPKKKTRSGSYVEAVVQGSKVQVWACRTSNSGKVRLMVDGRTVAKRDLFRKKGTKCGKVATLSVSPGKAHVVRLQALGTKAKKSKGRTVRFDAFSVS